MRAEIGKQSAADKQKDGRCQKYLDRRMYEQAVRDRFDRRELALGIYREEYAPPAELASQHQQAETGACYPQIACTPFGTTGFRDTDERRDDEKDRLEDLEYAVFMADMPGNTRIGKQYQCDKKNKTEYKLT